MMWKAIESVAHCPTEDALGILLEYLVDPKLPSKSSARCIPSQSDQELVAKQVHAVVLLYNYYHRKQHIHLEFLGFEDFCKLAVILRPTLLPHLKLMQLSNDTELDDLEKQLSLTEKMIMDACDISTSLDASKSVPSSEGWTISKVAVFLIDSVKENCLLQYGSITEGVWSVIEKAVELSFNNSKCNMDSEPTNRKKRFIRKPLRNEPGIDEAGLQQHAFSAVKEVTGITQGSLLVLERHVVYSTSKEKTAACFYIMQCTTNMNHINQNPIKDAINSLQGPLFIRSSSQWIRTSVVEYLHLLPYAEILNDWLSRQMLHDSLQVQKVGSETINVNCSKRIKESCESEVPKGSDRTQPGTKACFGLTKQNEDDGFHVVDLSSEKDEARNMDVDDSFAVNTQTDNYQKMMTSVDEYLSGLMKKGRTFDSLKRQRITQSRDGTVVSENKNCNNVSSDNNVMPIDDNALVEYQPNSNDLDKVSNIIASKNQDLDKLSTNALVEYQPNSDDPDKVSTIIASKNEELSQAALRVILSKRAKLCFQLRDIEDQIVQCDKNIQTILNGGEGDLALKLESLIERCNDVSGTSLIQVTCQHGDDKCLPQFRLPASMPNIQNSCQKLDVLCSQNDWILPTYRLSALDGGFKANVIVKGTDFDCSSDGNLHSHPREARESAAERMLIKLQNEPNIVW